MNATTKFYTGFLLALAVVIAVSFAIGYQVGRSHPSGVTRAAHGQPLNR